MASLNQTPNVSDASRYVLDITPYGITTASNTGNQVIAFRLPRQDFLVGQDIILNFNAEADGDAASDDKFMDNIACIWRNFRVKIDGEEIQFIREVGHLQSITDNLLHDASYRSSWGVICQGIPSLASSGTAVRYGMRLQHNNFLSNLIPCGKLGLIEVEFELDPIVSKYTTATTACTQVDVTQLQLRCPFLKSQELETKYNSQDVEISFFDHEHHRNTSLLSGATSHTIIVPSSNKSLDGILFAMRAQADVQDPNFAGTKRYTQANLTNALTRLSFVIDGEQVPKREIDCTNQVELYEALLEYAGARKGLDYKSPSFFDTNYDAASTSQFVVGYPFNALTGATNTVSGLDTASKTGQIEIHLSALTASADSQIDVWTRYTRVCKFMRNGGIAQSKK